MGFILAKRALRTSIIAEFFISDDTCRAEFVPRRRTGLRIRRIIGSNKRGGGDTIAAGCAGLAPICALN